MNSKLLRAKKTLEDLLSQHPSTNGVQIQIRGDDLIVGRPSADDTPDHRVRLTQLGSTRYGLSVRRHNGRWEKTPFVGSLSELAHTMHEFMPHLLAPF